MIQEVTITTEQLQVVWSGSFRAEDTKVIQESLIGYIARGHKLISIDLSGMDYIDGIGLGILVSISKEATKKGGHLEIKGQQGMVKDLLEMTQLDKVLDIT